ncbi:F-actin-capping protein subunit beta [Zancudomyces culisetae]|uniref:F-actin-capping protein subunit beta n=1 Tax=Zancudomyces culisetae TaxID=1213189 RepID=A0A1R1PWM7_ZANCU|nr:F-actin-capping protein subunit beta [Zancudomyces culisetae]|eukprot:OMH85292.1 F-actin-capping protein subunit beta [Zancudomyces culisetae]
MARLLELVPELTDELLSSVDQPLKIGTDTKTGMEFLICDYNRDGDSFRSPWSNQYFPDIEDGTYPSERARKLEIVANEAFKTYTKLYYDGGISSVYFWEGENSLACAILIKKVESGASNSKGAWDSIHVIDIDVRGRQATYRLTTTVMLYTVSNHGNVGQMNLSGSLTRQEERDCTLEDSNSHIVNIGRMVEDMEFKLRNSIQEVYFGKTKDIVNDLRSMTSLSDLQRKKAIHGEIFSQLMGRH